MGKQRTTTTTSQNNKKTQTRYQPTTPCAPPSPHTHTKKGKKRNYSWMLSKNDRQKLQRHPQTSKAGERPPGTRPASSVPEHLSLLGGQLATVIFLEQDAEPKGQLSRVTWSVTRGWGEACEVCERIMSPASEEQRHQQLYYCCSAVGSVQYLHFHLVCGYYPT